MREEPKTLLFYVVALTGLLISSILFTGCIGPLPLEPLTATPVPSPGTPAPARPTEGTQAGCPPISEWNLVHIPVLASVEANHLLISGTVYASDFKTPLPGAVLEVLLLPQESQAEPHSPPFKAFHAWFQTDGDGHYQAT